MVRRWWFVWLVVAMPAAWWAFVVPVGGTWDEPAHLVKAAAVWQGQLLGEHRSAVGDDGVRRETTDVTVPAWVGRVAGHDCFAAGDDPTCLPDPGTDQRLVRASTTAGPYPPLYYAAVGWPTRWIAGAPCVVVIRLVSAVWFATLMVWGWSFLRRAVSDRSAFVAVVVAATPTTLALGGAINPNGFEIGAAFAAWCAAAAIGAELRAGRNVGADSVASFMVSLTAAAAVRSLGPAIALAIVAFSTWCGVLPKRWWAATRVRRAVGRAAVATALGSGWIVIAGHYRSLDAHDRPGPAQLVVDGLSMVPIWAAQMFGSVDWGYSLTLIGVVAAAGWIVLVAHASRTAEPRSARVGVVALAAAVLIGPALLQLVSGGHVEQAWQGRYVSPVAVGLVVVSAVALDRSSPSTARRLGAGAAIASVVASLGVGGWKAAEWASARGRAPWSSTAWPQAPIAFVALVSAGTVVVSILAAAAAASTATFAATGPTVHPKPALGSNNVLESMVPADGVTWQTSTDRRGSGDSSRSRR